jgi:hypothetical protein
VPSGSQELLSSRWEFSDDQKTQTVLDCHLIIPLSSTMPRDNSGCYFLDCTAYGDRPISRITRVTYERSQTSTCLYPHQYPSISNMISRVDGPRDDWFHWPGYELHLQDFVWLAQMQTARRLLDRTRPSIPNRDPVLDRLLEEGTFHRNGDTDAPNSFEEFAMGHASAMANHLLMHIESLEAEVCVPPFGVGSKTDSMLPSAQSCQVRLRGVVS